MLFRTAFLDGIKAGRVTVAFRQWRRPTVKAGGTLRTPVGVLAIDGVDEHRREALTDRDAHAAGFPDRDALIAELDQQRAGQLYRIRFHLAGDDPRLALREDATLTPSDLTAIQHALARADARLLRLIADHEGVLAADLAATLALDRMVLKRKVRILKELGLTESLTRGYRLSPRGRAALRLLNE